jgi:hypothetical protein
VVKGLDLFRNWFADYTEQYVLIGGTAATMAMESAGLSFRATKDLDVVLHVEALSPEFGRTFWEFIQAGGYQIRQASDTGKPAFYRFQKPTNAAFPAMIELFSRAPDSLRPIKDGNLTPIPFDEAVSSLSAILLDDEYYAFIMAGRREVDGLPWIGEDRLIPLKAIAWLDLSARKEKDDPVDAKDVRKHVNDVLRLSQLLSPTTRILLTEKIVLDMKRFVDAANADSSLDPKALGLGNATVANILDRLALAYGLGV